MVKCLIQGKQVEELWDTVSQVRAVSRKWQQTHLLLEVLRNFKELLGAREELKLEAMNGTDIPFDGWIDVRFNLAGDDKTTDELTVPVLVGQKEEEYPIFSFNVVEEILSYHSAVIPFSSPHSTRCSGQSSAVKITGYWYVSCQSRKHTCYASKRRGNES